jgi:hypothetical protein
MNFPPDPLTLALGRENVRAIDERRDNVRRTLDSQSSRLPGTVAGDAFNRSLDLDVLDKPTGTLPEPADVPLWQQPLCATKAGIHGSELIHKGTGMVSNSPVEGTGKVNPVDPFVYASGKLPSLRMTKGST